MTSRANWIAIAVAAIGAGGAGFAIGYGWPREPIEDPAAKRLLSITEKIAVDVAGIQNKMANTEAPAHAAVAAPSASTPPAPVAARDIRAEQALAQSRQDANGIVSRGISSGRWTDNDVRELRSAMTGLSGEEKQFIVTPLLQAINAQQVKLEVEHGGAL